MSRRNKPQSEMPLKCWTYTLCPGHISMFKFQTKKTVWTTSALKKPKILFLIWVILKDRIKEIGKRLYINIHLASSQLSLSASGWNIPGLGWQLWFSFVVTDRWRKLNLQNFMWRCSKNPLSNAANDRPKCKSFSSLTGNKRPAPNASQSLEVKMPKNA